MLKSRTIYDRIIDRFALMELYGEEYRKDAMEKLDESVDVKSGNDEILVVSVEDKDPQRASDMANAFIDELKALTHNLAVTEASKRRLFLEELLKQTKQDLTVAEDSMRSFQEKTGVVKIEEQAESVIGSITQMRAQVAAKEVELKVMRTYTTPRNPDLQMAEEQLKGMKEQIAKLEAKSASSPDSLVPAGRIPAIGTDYMRNLRDMKYYETLYELIAKQYEMARMDEARDATIIQVLDRAVPPDKETSPRKAVIVACGISGLSLRYLPPSSWSLRKVSPTTASKRRFR
jgi:capsule polysaccharide export protein KpsE/RkpR